MRRGAVGEQQQRDAGDGHGDQLVQRDVAHELAFETRQRRHDYLSALASAPTARIAGSKRGVARVPEVQSQAVAEPGSG